MGRIFRLSVMKSGDVVCLVADNAASFVLVLGLQDLSKYFEVPSKNSASFIDSVASMTPRNDFIANVALLGIHPCESSFVFV